MKTQRLNLLKKIMSKNRLDTIILTTSRDTNFNSNIYYYTGFMGTGSFVMKKEPVLIVSAIEFEKAKKTKIATKILTKQNRVELFQKSIGDVKTIGVDTSILTVSQFEEIKSIVKLNNKNKIKFINIGKDLVNARAVKEKEEIESIKKACSVCDEIFLKIIKNFKFKTEKELSTFILMKIREKGLEPSFNPIVASGKNSSDVHHIPEGKITKGFLILDFGCKVNEYCSDMTRTLYVGKPSVDEMAMYEDLLSIQNVAIELVNPNKKCSEIDLFVRELLGERFLHNLGHGVGIEIHESPNLTSTSKDILKENMCITIEPGVYKERKYGLRIEDTILVTKKGPIRLTKSRKNLICVKN